MALEGRLVAMLSINTVLVLGIIAARLYEEYGRMLLSHAILDNTVSISFHTRGSCLCRYAPMVTLPTMALSNFHSPSPYHSVHGLARPHVAMLCSWGCPIPWWHTRKVSIPITPFSSSTEPVPTPLTRNRSWWTN